MYVWKISLAVKTFEVFWIKIEMQFWFVEVVYFVRNCIRKCAYWNRLRRNNGLQYLWFTNKLLFIGKNKTEMQSPNHLDYRECIRSCLSNCVNDSQFSKPTVNSNKWFFVVAILCFLLAVNFAISASFCRPYIFAHVLWHINFGKCFWLNHLFSCVIANLEDIF